MVFDILDHSLIPKHTKLSSEEEKKFLEKNKFTKEHLPRVLIDDPAIQHLKAKSGDIIKIERESQTAGTTYFYRVVSSA